MISNNGLVKGSLRVLGDLFSGDISAKNISATNYTGNLNGYKIGGQAGKNWTAVTTVRNDGVMDVGKVIDFHTTDTGTNDYDVRITALSSCLTLSGTTYGTFSGSLTGNVNGNSKTATTIQTPRLINGTSFSGGSDITTAKWGTARTITLTGAITGTLTTDGSANAALATAEGNVSFKRLGEVGATTDWNTLIDPGCYKVQMSAWGDAAKYHSPNQYGNIYQYGMLVVFKSNVVAEDRTIQIYLPHKGNEINGIVLTRIANSGGWQSWNPIFKGITKNYVGLGNVDNTADSAKKVLSATKWTTARNIGIGNAAISIDGSQNASCTLSQIGAVNKVGDTISGPLKSTYVTGTWLNGNQGNAILSSSAATAGSFISLMRYGSTNGYFCVSGYQDSLYATYTSKAKVDAGTNGTDKSLVLLNEAGNSNFPGTVSSAGGFSGNLNGTASKSTADASGNTITASYGAALETAGTALTLKSKSGVTLSRVTTQDTLNTAGSTASNSKLFIIGAAVQAANPITNSRNTCYIGTDGCLYSNNTKVSVEGHMHSYAGSSIAGGAANNLFYFKNTSMTDIGLDATDANAIGYVNNINVLGQKDGAVIKQCYSSTWMAEIFMDYRTGQLASRGKNNGTLQEWRTQLDSTNYTEYTPTKTGSGASGSWGISITGNAATASNATKATQDSAGQQINSTYLKGITASGQTLTLTKGNGATSTITTQDTLNTAGSTHSTQRLYLIGSPSQSDSEQTYSNYDYFVMNDGFYAKKIFLANQSGCGIYPSYYGADIGSNYTPFTNIYSNDFYGNFHGDLEGNLNGTLSDPKYIDGVKFNAGSDITHYGVCSTAASTVAKTVALTDFALSNGAKITVKFSSYNTASSITLNVNNTGAKYVKSYSTTNVPAYYWQGGSVIDFIYDGTYWVMVDGSYATTTYYGKVKLSNIYSSSISGSGIAASQSAVYNAYNSLNTKLSALGDQITITVSNGVCTIERKGT